MPAPMTAYQQACLHRHWQYDANAANAHCTRCGVTHAMRPEDWVAPSQPRGHYTPDNAPPEPDYPAPGQPGSCPNCGADCRSCREMYFPHDCPCGANG